MRYSDRHISDEELDQLFRDAQASEGQEALFVPEFWSEMEAMLPAAQKKKRGFYWIPLTAALILVGIVLCYPPNPVKIDRFAQNENESVADFTVATVQEEQNEEKFPTLHTQTHTPQNANENLNLHTPQDLVITKPKVKTTFTQKKQIRTQEVDNSLIEKTPLHSIDGNREVPEDIVVIPSPDADSNPFLTAMATHSFSDLDSVNLEARYESIPHEDVVPLPKKLSDESNEWYLELGPTLGKSPYLSPNQKRNIVGGAVLGGGYTKRIDNAFVSFGLQARMEGFGGLEYRETNFSPNVVRTVSVKQLYSLEVPLKFGYSFKRSEFALSVTPGVQLFIHGKERITENQVVQRQASFTGKVEHSNSLTMEFGLQYYYNITSRYSIGAKLNADILRPFHTDYYLGKSAGLPVNGQIVFRTRFSK